MHPELDMADLQLLEALPGAGPGVLWRARFRPTGHLLAVRIVQRPPAGRRAAIARAARRAMEADHPHVVTAYAFAQNTPTGALVLVREWLEAGPVPAGHKPFVEAARLAGEALSGLAFLHALGIAHGDLRASHLLQAHSSGPVRIADPGLSWATLLDGSPTVAGDLAAFGLIVREWFDPAEKPEIAHWLDRLLGAEQAYESAPEARDALAELAPEQVPRPNLPSLHASLPEGAGRAGWLPGLPSEGWGGRPLPLVGRDTEQRMLWAAIERARAESRPVGVVVRGEPGQGSRALLRCVSTRAAEAGLVRTLQVWHGPVPGPGQGLGAALRRALDLGGAAGPERVARLEQQLSRLDIPASDREVFRAWLVGGPERTPGPLFRYDAMLRFVEKYRRGRTVFLWIEDAQWGRDALCFAHHLLTRGSQLPVVLGLSLREPAPAGGWDPLLLSLLERPDVGELSLGRLGNASMRELLVGHLGLSPAASARISAMAGGNPLFGVEQVRALRRSGALQPGGGGASLAPGDALVGDIEAVWVERLRLALTRRPADDGILLRLAAIFGGVCQLDELWEAAQEMGLRTSEDLLDTMESEGLLRLDLSAGELRFAHGSLVRTLVRQAARTGHTRHLHEAIETVLARRTGEGPAGIARRVRHRLGAGDGPAAVALALMGAEERLSAGEPVPARALLDQVEAAAEALTPGDPRRGYFLNLRGYSALLEGKNAQVLRHAARAELEARRWGWPQVGAAGALQRAVLGIREGAWETALHDIEAAERAGRTQGDPLLGLLCSLHRCRLELRRGDLVRSEIHLARMDTLQAALGEMLEGERWRLHAEWAFELGRDPGPALDKARQYCTGWGLAELDTQAGLHLRASGRAAEARVCFGRSHAQHRALGTAPGFSPSLGLALLSLDRADPVEAGRYLDQAASNPGGSLGARTLHPLISARLVLENGGEALTNRFVAAVHRSLDGQVLRDRLCGEQARALSEQARQRGLLALANESERLAIRLQATLGPEFHHQEPEER